MSLAAYKSTLKRTETPRGLERRLMNQITARLAACQDAFDAAAPGSERLAVLAGPLRDALNDNVRLWMAYRADLADAGNTLPPDMRAGLISLAFYVERQTALVLKGQGSVRALIDINKPIIEALEGQTAEVA